MRTSDNAALLRETPPRSTWRQRLAHGFSLIELTVVTAILAILLSVLAPHVGMSQTVAISDMIIKIADAGTSNWSLVAGAAGVDASTGTGLVASGSTMADVMFTGAAAIAPAYQTVYDQSGIRPLISLVTPIPGQPGNYAIAGFPSTTVAVTPLQPNFIQFVFTNIPVEVVQTMTSHWQINYMVIIGSGPHSAGPEITYDCASAALCTLYLSRGV